MTAQDFKVGDILVYEWHYSMHYPVFLIVTRTTAKKVEVVEIEKRMTRSTDGGYNQQGYEVPREPYTRRRCDKPRLCNVDEHGVLICGYGSRHHAKHWDGKEIWADYMD